MILMDKATNARIGEALGPLLECRAIPGRNNVVLEYARRY